MISYCVSWIVTWLGGEIWKNVIVMSFIWWAKESILSLKHHFWFEGFLVKPSAPWVDLVRSLGPWILSILAATCEPIGYESLFYDQNHETVKIHFIFNLLQLLLVSSLFYYICISFCCNRSTYIWWKMKTCPPPLL